MKVFSSLFKLLKETKIQAVLIAAAFAYVLFPGFYDAGTWPLVTLDATYSLDPSWKLALSTFYAQKLNWGHDVVFTYGPLGFLCSRIGIGAGKYTLLLFDAFMAFNFFMVFYHGLTKSENKRLTLLLIATSVFILPPYLGAGTSIVLLAMQVFWLNRANENTSHLSNAMVVLLSVLLFFIKFNTGLICLVFSSVFCISNFILQKNQRLVYLIYLVLPYILILALSYLLNVSLIPYLIGGLSIVSGYNEVMFSDANYPEELFFAILALVLSALVLALRLKEHRGQLVKYLLAVFVFCSSAFVIYKQAFTRNDIQHISEFYNYFIFLLLCCGVFHLNTSYKNIGAVVTAIVFIVVFYAKKREDSLLQTAAERFYKKDYVSRFKNFSDSSGIYCYGQNKVPDRLKQHIGSSGIDAYPWNSQLLFENRLNYTPRPVFQSYSAYTPYLQKLNYDLYCSDKAPDFVMYEYETIDKRYPLFEEPRLQLSFLKNYFCADTFYYGGRPMLLLEKKKTGYTDIRFNKVQEYDLDIENGIVPEKDSYYEIYLEPRLSAKIASFFFHTPEIKLQVNTADGNWYEHKTSKGLLACGIFSEYYVNSTREFLNLLNNDTLDAGKRVKLYKFAPLSKAMFGSKVRIVEYKLSGK